MVVVVYNGFGFWDGYLSYLFVCSCLCSCLCLCVVLPGCNLTYTHHNADFVDSLPDDSMTTLLARSLSCDNCG